MVGKAMHNNHTTNLTDRHGVAVMDRPAAAVFVDEPDSCPICDGRGWTWDAWGGDPCPIGYRGFPPAAIAAHAREVRR